MKSSRSFIDLLTPPDPCLRGRNHPSLNIYRLREQNLDNVIITITPYPRRSLSAFRSEVSKVLFKMRSRLDREASPVASGIVRSGNAATVN